MLKENLLSIERTSRSLARLVECSFAGVDTVFSDNYFDLPAHKAITVTAPLTNGWDSARARSAFKIRSIHDTYSVRATN